MYTCSICGKQTGQRYYGIAVASKHTYVGRSFWGYDVNAAHARARENAASLVPQDERIIEIKTVVAHSRQEVADVYEC